MNIKILGKVSRIQGYCDAIIKCSPDPIAVKIAKLMLAEATEALAELRASQRDAKADA